MNPRYFQESLGHRIGLPMEDRLSRGGLNEPCNLVKWKTSVFEHSAIRLNFKRRFETTLWLQKIKELERRRDLLWATRRPSSTKDKIEIGIFRIFN